MTDSKQDKQYAAFEAWAIRDMPRLSLARSKLGGYLYADTNAALLGWEAATSSMQAQVEALRADAVTTAARFARLYGICRRTRWTDYGVPSIVEAAESAQAFQDLCEFLFADGLDNAIARRDAAIDASRQVEAGEVKP